MRDLRDRALIATLTYSFARIGAALKMKVEDLRPKGAGWELRLHEKGGKHHEMPATIPWPRRCAPTSMPPASKTTARAFCSARRAGTGVSNYRGADGAAGRAANDPPSGGGGWHFRAD